MLFATLRDSDKNIIAFGIVSKGTLAKWDWVFFNSRDLIFGRLVKLESFIDRKFFIIGWMDTRMKMHLACLVFQWCRTLRAVKNLCQRVYRWTLCTVSNRTQRKSLWNQPHRDERNKMKSYLPRCFESLKRSQTRVRNASPYYSEIWISFEQEASRVLKQN
jgi:hypothetical protein